LAIGIKAAILAELDCDERVLSYALNYWCSRPEYLAALRRGGARYALDGSIAGEVTQEQADIATQRLQQGRTIPK
jgi:sRNA-binding protein